MGNKNTYQCVLYEPGDKVVSKFKTLFGDADIMEVESTELKYVGIFPCQFLKFVGKGRDITDISQYFVPAKETVEKYKNGLNYFNDPKVTVKVERASKDKKTTVGVIGSSFAKQLKRDNTLTEEDLKPRVIPFGTFNAKPPVKENE